MNIRKSFLGVASSLVELGQTRLELLSLEASAEKSRLVRLLGYSFAALLFLTLAVLVFTIMVAVYVWPTDSRYMALGVLAAVYAVLGVVLLLLVRRSLVFDPPPFAATLDELRRDAGLFDRIRAAEEAEKEAERAEAQLRRARDLE
jgi:uncharacterized membrane protein YqjE